MVVYAVVKIVAKNCGNRFTNKMSSMIIYAHSCLKPLSNRPEAVKIHVQIIKFTCHLNMVFSPTIHIAGRILFTDMTVGCRCPGPSIYKTILQRKHNGIASFLRKLRHLKLNKMADVKEFLAIYIGDW